MDFTEKEKHNKERDAYSIGLRPTKKNKSKRKAKVNEQKAIDEDEIQRRDERPPFYNHVLFFTFSEENGTGENAMHTSEFNCPNSLSTREWTRPMRTVATEIGLAHQASRPNECRHLKAFHQRSLKPAAAVGC